MAPTGEGSALALPPLEIVNFLDHVASEKKVQSPRSTRALETYLDLHRHSAIGAALTGGERAQGHRYALRPD